MNNRTKQTNSHNYVAPNIKVVAFKVELGFGFGGSLTSARPGDGVVTFGGLMDHTDANDHSGLGQYINRGSIFGDDNN